MGLLSVIALTYPRSFYTFSIDRPAIEKVFWTVTWEAAMYRLAMVILSVAPAVMAGTIGFVQTNLASDVPGLAQTTDPDLVNAWGMAASATSPVWIGANGIGKHGQRIPFQGGFGENIHNAIAVSSHASLPWERSRWFPPLASPYAAALAGDASHLLESPRIAAEPG